MITSRSNFLLYSRHISLIMSYSTCTTSNKRSQLHNPPTAGFFARILGITHKNSSEMIQKNDKLLCLSRRDIINSLETLKSFNFSIKDITNVPMVLYMNALTLENRREVLVESGFSPISVTVLSKFVAAMNRDVSALKAYAYIPFETNVGRCLEECFTDIDVRSKENLPENIHLKNLRQIVLNSYLTKRLDMTQADIKKLWDVYSRIRHRNFKSIQRMIAILMNDLNFSKERIIKNSYLLYGEPDNLVKIMNEIKTIDNQDFKEILYRRPKIAMTPCETLQKTIEHIKSFNIPEKAIARCVEVLTLGPDTVLERLQDLNEIEEFKVLVTNPRVLRLVHYQNKARLRLDFLNQLKVKCASLNILSCSSESFARFARDGTDKSKGKDILVFLANIFEKSEIEIKDSISRHPNWCHISVVHINHCYNFLISRQFLQDDIFHNLHILLYPIKRIDEKLCQLKQNDIFEELQIKADYNNITKRELLTLALYLLELDFHFTGDGVWTEQQTQQVENFNNILPDFPETNKVYKFGMKPAGTQKISSLLNS